MDWARAKSIFIVVFILMNLFLISYNISNVSSQKISKQMISDSTSILEQRGIVLKCKIPMISGRHNDYDILPVYKILLINFKEPQTIQNIELIYKTLPNNSVDGKKPVEFPVWQITLEDGTHKDFEALQGKITN